MICSILGLQPALVQTLSKMPEVPVEIRRDDWELLKKIKQVLEPFKDATDLLSYHDASVSMVIPVVTMIIDALATENPAEEHGVLTLKRRLKMAMLRENRFASVETIEEYTVSTLLDSKYKGAFFRDPDTLQEATNILTEKLVNMLRHGNPLEVLYLCLTLTAHDADKANVTYA